MNPTLPHSPMRGRMQCFLMFGRIPDTDEARAAIRHLVSLRRRPSAFRLLNMGRIATRICTLGILGHRDDNRYRLIYGAKLQCIQAGISFKIIRRVFPEAPNCSRIMAEQERYRL